jgi:hypothetical protein
MWGVERGVHITRLWSTIGRPHRNAEILSDGHSLTMAITALEIGNVDDAEPSDILIRLRSGPSMTTAFATTRRLVSRRSSWCPLLM